MPRLNPFSTLQSRQIVICVSRGETLTQSTKCHMSCALMCHAVLVSATLCHAVLCQLLCCAVLLLLQLVDLGCGYGGTAVYIAQQLSCNAVGVNISPFQVGERTCIACFCLARFCLARTCCQHVEVFAFAPQARPRNASPGGQGRKHHITSHHIASDVCLVDCLLNRADVCPLHVRPILLGRHMQQLPPATLLLTSHRTALSAADDCMLPSPKTTHSRRSRPPMS
jgi:hypothetical protein